MTSVGIYNDAAWAEGLTFKLPADMPARLRWDVTASGEVSIGRDALVVPRRRHSVAAGAGSIYRAASRRARGCRSAISVCLEACAR